MEPKPYLLHALSPLHAGTGHAADVIDLPIARMKATGIPIVPGSSIKGVLRDARKKAPQGDNQPDVHHNKWLATFGPETANAADHAGALVVGDARLLALPVRSFKGTFAYVTSPLLLRLALRDLGKTERDYPVPALDPCQAQLASNDCVEGGKLYLQDLDIDVPSVDSASARAWAALVQSIGFAENDYLTRRFAIVDDETMSFLWDTATQLDQRVRINEETRTVDRGALWLEESLPAETLLIGLMEADQSRKADMKMRPEDVLNFALRKPAGAGDILLQLGGKSTTGRGRCRLLPVAAPSP